MNTSRMGTTSLLDRPVGRTFDRPAAWLVDAELRPVRTVLTILAVAYAALALATTAAGVVIVHASVMAGLRAWDLDVSHWFVQHRTRTQNHLALFISSCADTIAVIGAALVVAIVLAVKRRWRDVVLLVGGLSLEASVFITANALVRRGRPPVPTVGAVPTTYSFPSGHVAATLVLWGCFALLVGGALHHRLARALVWLVPVVVVAAVAWSRVYRGMHFATDVLVGIVLGALALATAVVATRASSLVETPRSPARARGEAP